MEVYVDMNILSSMKIEDFIIAIRNIDRANYILKFDDNVEKFINDFTSKIKLEKVIIENISVICRFLIRYYIPCNLILIKKLLDIFMNSDLSKCSSFNIARLIGISYLNSNINLETPTYQKLFDIFVNLGGFRNTNFTVKLFLLLNKIYNEKNLTNPNYIQMMHEYFVKNIDSITDINISYYLKDMSLRQDKTNDVIELILKKLLEKELPNELRYIYCFIALNITQLNYIPENILYLYKLYYYTYYYKDYIIDQKYYIDFDDIRHKLHKLICDAQNKMKNNSLTIDTQVEKTSISNSTTPKHVIDSFDNYLDQITKHRKLENETSK